MRCLCDLDLSAMAEGDVPAEQLAPAWIKVFEEFLDALRDERGMNKMRLEGKVNHLEFTYKLIVLCLKYLQEAYDPEIVDILRRHIRVAGTFNPEDMAGYMRSLEVLRNTANGIIAEIDARKAELKMMGGKTQAKAITRKEFERLIAQVSRYVHFHIDKKATMVSEFIEHYIAMRDEAAEIKKANARNR